MSKYLLKEIAAISISNIDKKSYDGQKEVKLCNYTDVYYNWSITENYYNKMMTSTASENEIKKYALVKGDVAITKDSETKVDIGQSTYIADEVEDLVLGYHCALIRPNEKIVLGAYINAYLHTKFATKYFENNASGSGQRYTLTLDSINDFQIYVPSLAKQKEIVKLLSDIDRKIEINNVINDNLQQQLKLMYDYWFNQFDFPNEEGKPYRASGGAMEWSPDLQREIPASWSCVPLEDILQRNSEAFDFSSIEPTVDLSIMPSGSIALDQVNRSDKFSTNLFRMNEGDILFGSIRPYLKKAGIAPCKGVVAGTIHSFRVKKESDYNFALFTLCGKAFFDYAVRVSTGTKMPIVSLDSIMSYKVPYSESIVRRFNRIDVRHLICSNVQETQKLASFRDWLLPMLMNGQATISD